MSSCYSIFSSTGCILSYSQSIKFFLESSKGIYCIFIPFYLAVFSSVFSLLFFHPDILGNADNLIFADPLSTPDHIVPEFYFLGLFYILRCIAFKLLGIICIVVFVMYLVY